MATAQQSQTPGRTTLLDAVNTLLMNIGEMPVSSLENQQVQDARLAEDTLLEFHKEGQARGWSWNMEFAYPFNRDANTGEIKVPTNIIQWSVDPYQLDGRYVLRGSRVYDRKERSYQISSDDSPLKADVTWLLSWDDSPEAYNRWTTIRSARVFASRVLGSDSLVNYTAIDEQAALTALMQVEYDQANPNSLTGGPFSAPFPTHAGR